MNWPGGSVSIFYAVSRAVQNEAVREATAAVP
jgi:hypothetical protein